MLKIEGKTFMNIQEAVQWLLENNALPFQCTANYAPLTEIGLGTIVNPSPAKVRIGSLIFFADSKVSTVVGITETGFICSNQYNNLVDDVAYVTNVAINASGHLITTFSDGQTQDAGLIKQVSSFSINASQHLIATYNDGTSSDLGAIFNGNITISGNLTATGGISGNAITGDSIIENMSGYTFVPSYSDETWTPIYVGAVKNGNKLTFVVFGSIILPSDKNILADLGAFYIPSAVANKLYPYSVGGENDILEQKVIKMNKKTDTPYTAEGTNCIVNMRKQSNAVVVRVSSNLTAGEYYFRIESTFLLADSLA